MENDIELTPAQKKALAKLPENVRELLLRDQSFIQKEKAAREKNWPLKNFVPNIAQIRALLPYSERHPTYPGGWPFLMIFRGGNGVGKTCGLAILLTGVCFGNKFLNNDYFNHKYFDECEAERMKRTFYIRIICKKADVEETGSIYQQIKKWIPMAQFEGKVSTYYTKIKMPAQGPEYLPVMIDIKTFDMDVVSFAGPDFDLLLYNEPAPQDIYAENVSRLRLGGRMAAFLTPIDQAAYLHKIETGTYPDGEVVVTKASIWDNCSDIPGTNGILSRPVIERMIRQWNETNPLEVSARENGEYMHLVGSIYTIFNSNVHKIPPMTIQPNWTIYKVIDPHDKKPPFVVWLAVTPMNNVYVIAEYPTDPWDRIQSTYLTIAQFVKEFKRIENGQNNKFPYIQAPLNIYRCIGDPNKFPERQPGTGRTMKQEYEWAGNENIIVKGIDDNVANGHEKVRSLILYDPQRKVEAPNLPQLYVFSSCTNVLSAFGQYRYSQKQGLSAGLSDKLDKTWECPMDAIRYFAVQFDGYTKNVSGQSLDRKAIDFSRDVNYIDRVEGYMERYI